MMTSQLAVPKWVKRPQVVEETDVVVASDSVPISYNDRIKDAEVTWHDLWKTEHVAKGQRDRVRDCSATLQDPADRLHDLLDDDCRRIADERLCWPTRFY